MRARLRKKMARRRVVMVNRTTGVVAFDKPISERYYLTQLAYLLPLPRKVKVGRLVNMPKERLK